VVDRRCPNCDALVAADAEWCGQCLASLREPAAPARASADEGGAPDARARPRRAGVTSPSAWRCPTCDAENDLATIECRICGTPFGRLFEPAPPAPSVTPGAAAAWSLVFPGIGHWLAARRADAFARFALGGWIGLMLLVVLASRGGASGLGPLAPLVALYAAAAAGLWAESAVDARRAAQHLPPVVSSRMLLWASVGLVALSVAIAMLVSVSSLSAAGG